MKLYNMAFTKICDGADVPTKLRDIRIINKAVDLHLSPREAVRQLRKEAGLSKNQNRRKNQSKFDKEKCNA